jgi:hypothetical protein
MPAPAIVQTSIGSANSGSSVSATFTVSAHNAIVVLVAWLDATSSIHTPSDGVNTYVQIGSTLQANNASQACYAAANIASGSTTVTVTSVGAVALTSFEIQVSEISNADPITPVESYSAASGNSAAPLTPTVPTTHTTSLLLTFSTGYSSVNVVHNGFTYASGNPDDFGYALAYDVQAVKGNYYCSFGTSSSDKWIAGIAVIGQPGTAINAVFLQQYTSTSYSGTSGSFSFTNNPMSGDLIFLALFGGGATTLSISDGTNTYYQVGSTINPGGGVRSLALFYAYNIIGGPLTISVSNGTTDNVSILAAEYQYLKVSTSPLGVESHNNGSGTALNSGSVTTTVDDLHLSIFNAAADGVGNITDGTTIIIALANTSFVLSHATAKIDASISAMATANNGAWIAQVVAFSFHRFPTPVLPTDAMFFGIT